MKKIVSLFTALLVATSLFAFDYGVIISATGSTNNSVDNLSFKQAAEANLWMNANFTPELNFAMDGFYSFDYNTAVSSFMQGSVQKADLNNFYLSGNYSHGNNGARFSFQLGRFYIADLTALFLSQKIDGAGLSVKTGNNNSINFYAGYTGLLNSKTNTIYAPDFTAKNTFLYSFAAPYIIGGFSAKFPSLFADQNFALEAVASIDANKFAYNRIYADLSLDGPIYKSFYYAMATSFEYTLPENIDSTNADSIANLSKVELSYFTSWNNLVISANAIYLSDKYTPITQQEATIDSAYYDSILKTGLTLSAKFINKIYLTAGADAVFIVEENNMISDFAGVQYSIAGRYQVLNDVQLSASVAQLFYADFTQPSYLVAKGSVKISL